MHSICTLHSLHTLYSTYLANRRIKREQRSNVESAGHWCRILIWPPDCYLRPATTSRPLSGHWLLESGTAVLLLDLLNLESMTFPNWIGRWKQRPIDAALSLPREEDYISNIPKISIYYIFLSIFQVFNVFRLRDLHFGRVLFCFAIFRAVQPVQSNLRGKWKVGVETSSVYRERERCSRIAMHGTWKWRRMYKNPKYTCYIL